MLATLYNEADMGQERGEKPSNPEINREVLIAYAQTFLSRFDRYPLQNPDGSYYAVQEPLTLDLLRQHVYGQVTLGAYALDEDSQVKWVCLDADDEEQWEGLWRLAFELSQEHVPAYLEPSRRGGHLWLFLDEPLSGKDARRFAKQLLWEQDLTSVEVYPKQDSLRTGPGSLVRLPLGVHRKVNRRYHFVDRSGQPLAPTVREQIQMLASPERVPSVFTNMVLALAPEPKPLPPLTGFQGSTDTTSEKEVSKRIKDHISVYDFVSQFVDLSHSGKGLCPFHDDHRESFSVNREHNYWHCFAGCGGGSLIDFWMKWRQMQGMSPDVTETITELAKMLL